MKEPIFIPPVEQPGDDTIRANVAILFTVQERLTISDLIQKGKIDFVGAALEVENPERAYWLDQYLILKRPHDEPEESVVRVEMREWQGKGNDIDSQEKAAFWQARLDAEKNGEKLPDLEEALKAIEAPKEVESDIVSPDVVNTPTEAPVESSTESVEPPVKEETFGSHKLSKPELKAALDAKGIKYSSTANKPELQSLLDAA